MQALLALVISFIWGSTNNLISKYTPNTESGRDIGLVKRLIFYLKHRKFLASLLTNQVGSVIFYISVSNTDKEISSFIPLINSLTVLFTFLLQPDILNILYSPKYNFNFENFKKLRLKRKLLGIFCILLGTYIISI